MRYLFQLVLFSSLAFIVDTDFAEARRRGCGKGCQASMGSCSINASIWRASIGLGTRTSCCRSQAYTRQLRQCGYKASFRSNHLTGCAMDFLGSSQSRCKQIERGFRARGIASVSVSLHHGPIHCHANLCGSQRHVARSANRARNSARAVRQRNRQRASYSYYNPRRRQRTNYTYDYYRPDNWFTRVFSDSN